MKAITLRLSDDDHAVLVARAAAKRYSAAQYLLSLMDADLKGSAPAAAPTRKMTKAEEEELVRPFRKHLTTIRGFSGPYLDTIKREAEYQIYMDNIKPGPDGTLNGSSTLTEAERLMDLDAFNASTGQHHNVGYKPVTPFDAPAQGNAAPQKPMPDPMDDPDAIDFED